MADKLTPKQEEFCQLFVKIGEAGEAYRRAYNSKASKDSLYVSASRLRAQDKISLRIDEIRKELAASNRIDLDGLLGELEEARQIAINEGTASSAVAATMGKAKLLGLDKPIADPDEEDSPSLNITFEVREPVGDVKVTNAKPE